MPAAPKESAGAAAALLWEDVQTRFDAAGTSAFAESEVKVQSAQGLAALGNLSFAWSPATDTLTVHRLRILRGAQVIDLMPKDGAFAILRREAGLDTQGRLDGVLTAVVQPEGLQVGDVLDVAFTLRREDPLLKGRADADLVGFDTAPLGRVRLRTLWPKGAGVRWRVANGLTDPKLSDHGGEVEALFEADDLQPLAKPQGAPARFRLGRELTLSNYADWSAVSALMAPLFEEAERLPPNSPVTAEARAIAARTSDPAARATAALALVQDKVRYFLQAIGDGGLKPASADQTWTRRWGDCKAKTVLLLALLKALGVQAEPVLAASAQGAGLDERLPALSAFDHVLVRATIAGKDYWLDGTRLGDTSLAAIQTPDFGFVLPVRAQGATLIPLRPPPADKPFDKVAVRIDATAGTDKPAPFHVERDVRGDVGLGLKLQLADLSPDDLDRALRAYWREQYDFVEIGKVSAAYDASSGTERILMDGAAKIDWSSGGHDVDGAMLGFRVDAHRDPGPHADAPFAVTYPSYDVIEETVLLPDQGRGFSILGTSIDCELEGYAFLRRFTVSDGVFHMEASSRALKPEITLAQAQADASTLTELAKSTIRIRPPFDPNRVSEDKKALLETQPATRDGYLFRGDALLDDGAYGDAEHDFDRAVDLDAGSATALANRGLARVWLGRFAAANADLDKAATLDPRNVVVWRARGLMAWKETRWADAVTAFTEALALQPGDLFSLRFRADAYSDLNENGLALADIDTGLKTSPKSTAFHTERAALLLKMKDRAGARKELDLVPADGTLATGSARLEILRGLGDRPGAFAEADALVRTAPGGRSLLLRALNRNPSDTTGIEADAQAAYAADPTLIQAALLLADSRTRAKDYAGALSWIEKIKSAAPREPDLLILLAGAQFRVHPDPAQAKRDFAAARTVSTGDAGHLNTLCYEQAKLDVDLGLALGDCDASLALRPKSAPVLDSRAFVLLRMGRNAEAKTVYDQALAIQSTLADSLYGRSLAERKLGDATAADRDLQAAKVADPKVVETFAGYGVTR